MVPNRIGGQTGPQELHRSPIGAGAGSVVRPIRGALSAESAGGRQRRGAGAGDGGRTPRSSVRARSWPRTGRFGYARATRPEGVGAGSAGTGSGSTGVRACSISAWRRRRTFRRSSCGKGAPRRAFAAASSLRTRSSRCGQWRQPAPGRAAGVPAGPPGPTGPRRPAPRG